MHFSMHRLELPLVVERSRLAGRCEGLAEEREQQDDCEQSVHEIGSRQLRIRRNDSRRLLLVSQKPTSNTWYQGLAAMYRGTEESVRCRSPLDPRHDLVRMAAPSAKTEFGTFSRGSCRFGGASRFGVGAAAGGSSTAHPVAR